MNAELGLTGFVCDLVEQSWAVKAELRMQCWTVCDLAEQSWAVKAEL